MDIILIFQAVHRNEKFVQDFGKPSNGDNTLILIQNNSDKHSNPGKKRRIGKFMPSHE
jgi:hypothetical protein